MPSSAPSSNGQNGEKKPQPDGIVKLLCSFFFFRDADMAALKRKFSPYPVEILADSGAFSAFTMGKPIKLDDYCAWLDRWKSSIDVYANLDVIGSAQRTWDHQEEMERRGFSPIPIFHYSDPWNYFDSYVDRYPYFMLSAKGGRRERTWNRLMPYFIHCFKRAQGRSVFHGLAVSAHGILSRLPFYSCDASTYVNSTKFGNLALFDDRRGEWVTLRTNGSTVKPAHYDLLWDYGISEQMLRVDLPRIHREHQAKGRGRGLSPYLTIMQSVSSSACLRYETWVRRRLGEVQIPGRPDRPPGLRYYLVVFPDVWFAERYDSLGLYQYLARVHRVTASSLSAKAGSDAE